MEAASFNAKLQSFVECIRNITPGSLLGILGSDFISHIQSFSRLLLSFIPKHPPGLGYIDLYEALIDSMNILPLLQSNSQASIEILRCLACLIPFLTAETLRNYFVDFNRLLSISHEIVYKDIIMIFCESIIPQLFGLSKIEDEEFLLRTFPATIAITFEYISQCNLQSSFCEALLCSKRNLINDMLQVVAFGSYNAKIAATAAIFKYWPINNQLDFDKRLVAYNMHPRNPTYCQTSDCNVHFSIASWVCINATVFQDPSDPAPPPYFLCNDCYELLSEAQAQSTKVIIQPVVQICSTCQHPNCSSEDNCLHAVCYSPGCYSLNSNRPLSLCLQCHKNCHLKGYQSAGHSHIYQTILLPYDQLEKVMQTNLIKTVISLFHASVQTKQVHPENDQCTDSSNDASQKILSHYAISLLIYAVNPTCKIPPRAFTELLYTIFEWLTSTVCLPDDAVSAMTEKLKVKNLIPWVKETIALNLDLTKCVLLPLSSTPFDLSQNWENVANQTVEIRNGLNVLYSLVTYDLINLQTWNFIIPYWLEVVYSALPESNFEDFSTLLNKLFDYEMSPMLASNADLYGFLTVRFESPALIQEQALCWMQMLCKLRVSIPMYYLLNVMLTGVQSLIKLESRASRREIFHGSSDTSVEASKLPVCAVFDTYETYRAHRNQLMMQQLSGQEMISIIKEEEEEFIINENQLNAPCCLLMLDILLSQVTMSIQ
ncbi:hypothetical protein GJ496_002782 [Pomphorhynchus laevis]|nr:hypothetical protein GJ496_002782 [Pomphorhynchus laevis]